MARRSTDSTTTDTTPSTGDTATSNAVEQAAEASRQPATDDNGQVLPDSPQATPVVAFSDGNPTRQYATGTGLEVGNAATSDLYLDEDGKVTSKAPERGQTLTIKGAPVEPWAARVIAEQNYSG